MDDQHAWSREVEPGWDRSTSYALGQCAVSWFKPLLEGFLEQFPFVIFNFHSDNGSELINKAVAQLLDKLLLEQVKIRPSKSGDNGLVETKNAAIIRKHNGWGHIAPGDATPINQFYAGFLNPYVNCHRLSAQAEVQIDARGRIIEEAFPSK
jgi:transposase InsO family protein